MTRIRDNMVFLLKVFVLLSIIICNDSFVRQMKKYQLNVHNVHQWNIMNNPIMNNLNNLNPENLEKYPFSETDSTIDDLSTEILLNATNTPIPSGM